MPNPISGTAVALAATQLRIINLDQVLDTNISTSMNFAIDFANQTFRMTGLQLTDYLNQSLAITAGNVGFDNATFQAVFPLEPSPPTNAQDVIDYGLPILANADTGNIGKTNVLAFSGDLNNLQNAGFYYTNSSVLNRPQDTMAGLVIVTSGTTNRTSQFFVDLGGLITATRANVDGAWTGWQLQFSSAARTSAQANVSLDLADTAMQQTDLDAYLPLVGGTVTGVLKVVGDTNVMQISPANVGASAYTMYLNGNGTVIGNTGLVDAGNDDMIIEASLTNLQLRSVSQVNVTAPIGVNLNSPLVSISGATTAVGDITAFLGVAVVVQPFIAATGATTAYDLIELLLDKVDELETRLANAGIA